MKVITITEKNINDVYGKLCKFFYNNNSTGFESWHNFDCSFKKHISRYIYKYPKLRGETIRISHSYPAPEKISLGANKIVVSLTAGEGYTLDCGDKIAFLGNRIIQRREWGYSEEKYVYEVFQALPMSKQEQEERQLAAKREEMAYLGSDYDDYEDWED